MNSRTAVFFWETLGFLNCKRQKLHIYSENLLKFKYSNIKLPFNVAAVSVGDLGCRSNVKYNIQYDSLAKRMKIEVIEVFTVKSCLCVIVALTVSFIIYTWAVHSAKASVWVHIS